MWKQIIYRRIDRNVEADYIGRIDRNVEADYIWAN